MWIDIHEAEAQFSRSIERALQGEDVAIAKAGHPLVRLVGIDEEAPLELGSASGRFAMLPDGWDAPLADREVEEWFGK